MISYDFIVAEVTSRLGNRTDISPRIGRWINYAFFELLLNPRFSFFELDKGPIFFNTVVNQNVYTIGTDIPISDLWIILDLRDSTNQRRIRRVHFTEIDKTSLTIGQPVRYYRYANTVVFDPTPDLIYQIQLRYRTRPADFVSGSNLLLGTEWEEPLIALSTIRGWEALEQREKAMELRNSVELSFRTRMDVPTLEDSDAEPTIQPSLLFPSF